MSSWNEIIQDYIVRHSDDIQEATKPLHDHFGVSYFTYHRIDANGKYTVLHDRPDWAELYVGAEIYRQDPYLRHPDNYSSGLCMIENNGSEEYLETVFREAKKIELDLGVMVIERKADCVEFFGFAANKARSSLEKIYLNQPSLLKSFAGYFKQKLSGHILSMENGSNFLLTDLKDKDFFSQRPVFPGIPKASHLAFLRDIGMARYVRYAEVLSARERECLKLLVGGKSAKETAILLGLSPRTVESYFDNIKLKLSCVSKGQIFTIAERLRDLDLL